jgi:serine protease Do
VKKRSSLIVGLLFAAAVSSAALFASYMNGTSRTFAESNDEPLRTGDGWASFGAQTFRDIAEAQTPMVVNIRTESRRQTRDLSEFFDGNDLLERFFGFPPFPPQPRDQITQGAGSGFIIDENGLILTNSHVVTGATKITVALYADEEGEEYDARVVGRDPLTDSALIELTEKPSQDLPVATLGRSGDIKPGDWVMAIGNPFNLAHTVTVGVVSAIGRPFPVSEGRWQDVLQTDAAINPGNSGGPLLNLRGEVVGINTAIFTGGPVAGNVGVGFAIPIDAVRELLPELREGTITRGRIGVQIMPVTKDLAEPLGLKEPEGALVRLVERRGPAAAAGIEPGDVIVRYNEKPVVESDDLVEMVTRTTPGTTVPVEIVRDGQHRTVRVTVSPLELEDDGAQSGSPSDTGFGMSLRDLTPQLRTQLGLPTGRAGALVAAVEPASPAARAGVRAGDVILEVNRMAVSGASEAARLLRGVAEGNTAFALLWRQGQELFVTMTRE